MASFVGNRGSLHPPPTEKGLATPLTEAGHQLLPLYMNKFIACLDEEVHSPGIGIVIYLVN